MRLKDAGWGVGVLTSFTRFVVVPDPGAQPSRAYRGVITCTECDWSVETELRIDEVHRLLCGGCGKLEVMRLLCPECG